MYTVVEDSLLENEYQEWEQKVLKALGLNDGAFLKDTEWKKIAKAIDEVNGEVKKMLIYPNIEAERARRGLTVAELTNKLHVCRKTYYNWIARGKIPQEKLQAMADLFEVPVGYLTINSDDKKKSNNFGG